MMLFGLLCNTVLVVKRMRWNKAQDDDVLLRATRSS
jgi:hypothetical protein